MKNVFAETFPSGSIKASVYSITLVNNTAKIQDVSVPTDCIWEVQSIQMMNPDDVARICTIKIFLTSAKTIELLKIADTTVNAGSRVVHPNNDDLAFGVPNNMYPFILNSGWTLEFYWYSGGASTGATDADGLVIVYRELSKT